MTQHLDVDLMSNEEHQRRSSRLSVGQVLPMVILAVFVLAGLLADFIAPHSPRGINLANSLLPPVWEGGTIEHPLGTDALGRDILSRLIYGARVSLSVVSITILISGSIGTALGVLAGYKGGLIDAIISRVVDVMLGFPSILLALIIAATLGASFVNIIIVVTLLLWARYARQARAETLKIREMDYVTLARVAGVSDLTIMRRHILPNILSTLIVLATLQVGSVILLEASLSFLGVGIPPPAPSWGGMASEGRAYIVSAWWLTAMPGMAIVLVVLSSNLFGDFLRDRLDPKFRGM